MKQAYAIDFGTSNTLVVSVTKDEISPPLAIEDDGSEIFKSLIFYSSEFEASFGASAIREYTENSFEGRFIRSIKKFLPDENFLGTIIDNRNYSIEALIGSFLRELKTRADTISKADVEHLVLGRPARFSMDQRKDRLAEDRLYRAARIAGFKEVSFYAEPLAAAYDFPKNKSYKNVFVIDLGAGTSDFSAVRLKDSNSYDVLAIHAISVAGDAFDGALMDYKISPHFGTQVEYKLPLSSNFLKMPEDIRYRLRSPADICFLTRSDIKFFLEDIEKSHVSSEDKKRIQALQILLEDNLAYDIYSHVENSKIQLCIEGNNIFTYKYPGISIAENLSINDLVMASENQREKILSALQETLQASHLKPKDFDIVLLTGGSCKIPFLRDDFAKIFGEDKLHFSSSFSSVVSGLGVEAQRRYF